MERSGEIVALTLRLYDAMSTGDISFLEHIYSRSDGVHFISTNPDEWWTDYENHINAVKAQLEQMGEIQFIASDPQGYVEGTVGWVADHPKVRLADTTEFPVRVTFVFHQEAGEWKIVQAHVSIGEGNVD